MIRIRQFAALTGIAVIVSIAILLVVEITTKSSEGTKNTRWRAGIADAIDRVLDPGMRPWQSALIGAALSIVALLLVVAEFGRPAKGTRVMHNVHSTQNGETRLSGRAAIRAARLETRGITGVVDTDATIAGKHITVTVRVDDRADLEVVEEEARQRLGHQFWINLGLADFAVNLLVTHHPKPPRVR